MSKIFKSKLYQDIDTGILDASRLYKDAEEWIENEKKEKGVERLHRWHPLQHLLNSTSGNYISPTAMKGFEQCPANYLYSKLVIEKKGSATSIGSTFHAIAQNFYNEKPENRTKEKLYELMEKQIEEDDQEESRKDVEFYVERFWNMPDYLTGRPMNHKNLTCVTETFIRPTINPLGVNLNVPIYTLIDRVDIRDDGIYIVDYKTGVGDPNPYLLGEHGYLPQMIFYKWAVESEYGQTPKGVYLGLPGADSNEYMYTKMNVDSLVEQSKVVDAIDAHLKRIRNARETLKFEESTMRYCNSCQMKYMCKKFCESREISEDLTDIKEVIDVEIEIEDKYGEGDDAI